MHTAKRSCRGLAHLADAPRFSVRELRAAVFLCLVLTGMVWGGVCLDRFWLG